VAGDRIALTCADRDARCIGAGPGIAHAACSESADRINEQVRPWKDAHGWRSVRHSLGVIWIWLHRPQTVQNYPKEPSTIWQIEYEVDEFLTEYC